MKRGIVCGMSYFLVAGIIMALTIPLVLPAGSPGLGQDASVWAGGVVLPICALVGFIVGFIQQGRESWVFRRPRHSAHLMGIAITVVLMAISIVTVARAAHSSVRTAQAPPLLTAGRV
ncbi:MAG TPA: hypothetical protein VFJ58_21875 [Armatimonadota bacterium]|nr:hypothetical protein [Armatimonadota bacterium]